MIKFIQFIGLCILAMVLLVACSSDELSHYEIINKEVIYNSEAHSLEYIGEIDVDVVYENNTHTESGEYEVKAIFSKGDNVKESYATLTILPYTLTLDDLNINNVVFNNEFQYITFDTIENIEYEFKEINEYKEVGLYYNTLIINSNNKNYTSTSIDIVFEVLENYELILNNTLTKDIVMDFNYEYHKMLLPNHNELIKHGFEVHYYYDNVEEFPIEAGIYDVYITIEKDNLFKELNSKLTINKRSIKPVITGDNLIETNTDYTFDIFVDSNYINICYRYYDINGNVIDKPTTVGHYFIEPILYPLHDNYEIKHTFKHFEIILSKHDSELLYNSTFTNKEVVYNNEFHSLILDNHNALIEHKFDIVYSFNMHKEIGVYEISVTISKFGYQREMTAFLTINQLVLYPYFDDITIKEGQYYNLILNNYGIEYTYKYYNEYNDEIGKPSTFGNYFVGVTFYNDNENILINNFIYEFTINLSDYDQSLIDNAFLYDKIVEYNGRYQYVSISNSSDLSMSRYTITYSYNDEVVPPVEKGIYIVEANIIKNNIIIKTLYSTLEII